MAILTNSKNLSENGIETSLLIEENTNNLLQNLTSLRNEVSVFSEEKDELEKTTKRMSKEINSLETEITEMIEANKGRDEEILHLKETISEILPMIKEASKKLDETNQENRGLKNKNANLLKEITTLKDMENYNEEIKSVIKRMDDITNLKDKISEVLENETKVLEEVNKRMEKEMKSLQKMITENKELINATMRMNLVPTIWKEGKLWKVSLSLPNS